MQSRIYQRKLRGKGKMKAEYNIGDYISSKDGKLEIKNDKKRLIKFAEKEIKEWQGVLDKAEKEIEKWQKFIKNLKRGKA